MARDSESLNQQLSREISDYIASADQSIAPFDYEAIRPACEVIEFLLSALLETRTEWRGQWVDGVLPDTVEVTEGETVRIFGEAILVAGQDNWTLRPILAEISLTNTSEIRVSGESDAAPYVGGRARILQEPTEWPHVFEFDLRR